MTVGVGQIVLDYFNNDSMKLKRKYIDDLSKELKQKFDLSVVEIDDIEDPERIVIGFAAVIPNHWRKIAANNFLESICKYVDEKSVARVISEDFEILSPNFN